MNAGGRTEMYDSSATVCRCFLDAFCFCETRRDVESHCRALCQMSICSAFRQTSSVERFAIRVVASSVADHVERVVDMCLCNERETTCVMLSVLFDVVAEQSMVRAQL